MLYYVIKADIYDGWLNSAVALTKLWNCSVNFESLGLSVML